MKTIILSLSLFVLGATAQAIVIDDFSGNLSAWTSTMILDANGGGTNTAVWQIADGVLQLNTTAYNGIEQYAMIRNGLSLDVGEEVQMRLTHNAASQDLGLYVGGTAPQTGVRQDYVAMYARHTGEVFSRGFDGTGEYGQVGWVSPAYEKLFIARTGINTYEAGYYVDGVRTVLVTRTPTTANDATHVGFYADVRASGILGDIDSLELWSASWAPHEPNPATGNPSAGTVNISNNTVDVTLNWQAGLDPYNEAQVNPAITKHYVFMSDTPADPNLYYLGTVAQPQPDADASTTFGTVSGLTEVTAYRWAVVEALSGYDQAAFTLASTLEDVDPNNIIGPTWTFTTAVGVERRLVGEYLFENDLADTAEGNNGSLADPNIPSFDDADPVSATSGSYAVFNGTDNFVNLGTAAYPKAGAFPYGVGAGLEEGTITCWVKPSAVGGLISNYNGGTTTGFALSLANNNGLIDSRLNVRGESGDVGTVQGRPTMTGWGMLSDGRWHMVAATWKWGEDVRVYVDGGLVASAAAASPTEFADWQYGVLLGATRSSADRSVLQNFYGGFMDTLRIYNYVLTAEEIAGEYYQTTGEPACTNPNFDGSELNFDNTFASYCRIDLADFAEFAAAWLNNGLSTGE